MTPHREASLADRIGTRSGRPGGRHLREEIADGRACGAKVFAHTPVEDAWTRGHRAPSAATDEDLIIERIVGCQSGPDG